MVEILVIYTQDLTCHSLSINNDNVCVHVCIVAHAKNQALICCNFLDLAMFHRISTLLNVFYIML